MFDNKENLETLAIINQGIDQVKELEEYMDNTSIEADAVKELLTNKQFAIKKLANDLKEGNVGEIIGEDLDVILDAYALSKVLGEETKRHQDELLDVVRELQFYQKLGFIKTQTVKKYNHLARTVMDNADTLVIIIQDITEIERSI